MPPASRGQIWWLLRSRTRHASSTAIPDIAKGSARLTKAIPPPRAKLKDLPSSSTTPPPPPPSPPPLPKHDPNAPYVPFRGPPGAPSIGVRLVNAFGPRLRPYIQFVLYTIPWIPPFYLALMHTPINVIPTRGQSMVPSLNGDHVADEPNADDWVLVDARDNIKPRLRRGMVVVYKSPHDPERWGVKRVIALEGDQVTPKPGYPGGDEPLIVPWGHVWVEGDAEERNKSLDSNWFGPISLNLIVGRVTWVLWPWKHFAEMKWRDVELPDRLAMNAVRLENPDAEPVTDVFRNGYAQGILARLRDPTTGAAEMNYMAQPLVLVGLLVTCRNEVEKHDPDTEALAAALYREVKLALDHKGKVPVKMPVEKLPTDEPRDIEEAHAPGDTNAAATVESLFQKAVLAPEKADQMPKRTPPTVVPMYNDGPSAPYTQDTSRPVVS